MQPANSQKVFLMAGLSEAGLVEWWRVDRRGRQLIFGGFPFENLEVEDKDGIHHGHLQLGDHGGHQQAADLRVAERLPQWASVQSQRQQRQYRGAHSNQDRTETPDTRGNQRQFKVISLGVPLLDKVEQNDWGA